MTEATRLLVRVVVVDEEMLLYVISRFWIRTSQCMVAAHILREHPFKWLTRYLDQQKLGVQQKKNIQYLKLALENLRNADKSDLLINYEQGITFVSKYSIGQLVFAIHLTVLLTPGAKYHSDITNHLQSTPDFRAVGLQRSRSSPDILQYHSDTNQPQSTPNIRDMVLQRSLTSPTKH